MFKDTNISVFYRESQGLADFYTQYIKYLHGLLENVDHQAVEEIGNLFLRTKDSGKTIFFIGNGGSAATASHFCEDLAEVGRKAGVPIFRTLSLTDNTSYITAIANDYGYEHVFTKQMAGLFEEGDVLVAISVSGNSPNVVNAVEMAKANGGTTVGFVGFDGGKLAELCEHVLKVECHKGEYGPPEDAHMIFDHVITTYLTFRLHENVK